MSDRCLLRLRILAAACLIEPEAKVRRTDGTFMDSPFLSDDKLFETGGARLPVTEARPAGS